jgi:hypothetical protein
MMKLNKYVGALVLGASCFTVGCGVEAEESISEPRMEEIAQVDEVSAAADTWCSCVNYMFRRYTFWGSWGPASAKDYGSWLVSNHGYTKVSTPAYGDVVIMQPGFTGAPVDATHGHIAVVSSIQVSGSTRRILYTGANQPGTQFSSYTCYNVTNNWTSYHSTSDTKIAYYRR